MTLEKKWPPFGKGTRITIDGKPIEQIDAYKLSVQDGDYAEALRKGFMTESETRRLVFEYLASIDEDWVVYYGTIAKATGLSVTQARNAVRKLVRDGLAEHVHGLIDHETGTAAGSGHRLTTAGFEQARAKHGSDT